MLTQEELREILDTRIRTAGPRRSEASAVAVLRGFDPRGFARSVLDFATWLSPDARARWQADFTRTVFLAGNPRNLAGRLPPSVVASDGQVAWYAAGPRLAHRELRLLLRAFQGDLPPVMPGPFTLDVPHTPAAPPRVGGVRRLRMTVATSGLSLPRYLVHVNHTLAESLLTGVLLPGDLLTVHHADELPEPTQRHAYLRVHQDPAAPHLLRAFARVEEDEGEGQEEREGEGEGQEEGTRG
ncbi:DUF6182 family protein [Streptomyces rectiviolaceus]|uniref:Uncharacterized protein n=1 Tax=Streptomyces rectiviolaceus TaxID=332591 RepID=A0ABP6MD77_9ACTN